MVGTGIELLKDPTVGRLFRGADAEGTRLSAHAADESLQVADGTAKLMPEGWPTAASLMPLSKPMLTIPMTSPDSAS